MTEVYPHGRGGASLTAMSHRPASGLSPRAWGSPPLSSGGSGSQRSIPTGVGEPLLFVEMVAKAAVYPHGRGGAGLPSRTHPTGPGLSPRAWGSQSAWLIRQGRLGSIPTGVGEPMARGCNNPNIPVYPHGRGGANSLVFTRTLLRGLSPRAWGSLQKEF